MAAKERRSISKRNRAVGEETRTGKRQAKQATHGAPRDGA